MLPCPLFSLSPSSSACQWLHPPVAQPLTAVMRAEGVLRLILNVSLYVGITCLEDGKHIRMTVFEDGEVKHITFRVSRSLCIRLHC